MGEVKLSNGWLLRFGAENHEYKISNCTFYDSIEVIEHPQPSADNSHLLVPATTTTSTTTNDNVIDLVDGSDTDNYNSGDNSGGSINNSTSGTDSNLNNPNNNSNSSPSSNSNNDPSDNPSNSNSDNNSDSSNSTTFTNNNTDNNANTSLIVSNNNVPNSPEKNHNGASSSSENGASKHTQSIISSNNNNNNSILGSPTISTTSSPALSYHVGGFVLSKRDENDSYSTKDYIHKIMAIIYDHDDVGDEKYIIVGQYFRYAKDKCVPNYRSFPTREVLCTDVLEEVVVTKFIRPVAVYEGLTNIPKEEMDMLSYFQHRYFVELDNIVAERDDQFVGILRTEEKLKEVWKDRFIARDPDYVTSKLKELLGDWDDPDLIEEDNKFLESYDTTTVTPTITTIDISEDMGDGKRRGAKRGRPSTSKRILLDEDEDEFEEEERLHSSKRRGSRDSSKDNMDKHKHKHDKDDDDKYNHKPSSTRGRKRKDKNIENNDDPWKPTPSFDDYVSTFPFKDNMELLSDVDREKVLEALDKLDSRISEFLQPKFRR